MIVLCAFSEACLCTGEMGSKFRLVVESCRKSPKLDGFVTPESFGTNWLSDSEPDANLDIASLLASRAICRLRGEKRKVYSVDNTYFFPVTAFYSMHNAFATLCIELFKNLYSRRAYAFPLFLQAVTREVLQPRLANTKLLATSKHHRAKLPLSWKLSEIFEVLPRLCEITWRFQTTRAFMVLNLRRRRPAAFWNIEKCSNLSIRLSVYLSSCRHLSSLLLTWFTL